MSTNQPRESFSDRLRLDGSWEGKGWNVAACLGAIAVFIATVAKVVAEIDKEANTPSSVQAPLTPNTASPLKDDPEARLSDAKKSNVTTEK